MTLNERNQKIESHNKKALARLVSTEKPNDSRFNDLTGSVFTRLVVTRYAGKDKNRNHYYFVKCECGSLEKIVPYPHLKSGRTTSCNCLSEEKTSECKRTHGLSKDPWYKRAKNQQSRMCNPNHNNYKDYGGRGLVFGEGMETIEERVLFYREAFGLEPPEKLEIDRSDNDLGYAKDNVSLVSRRENVMNRRISHGFSGGPTDKQSRIYTAWENNKRRGNLCDEWAVDFKVFLADIGGRDLPKDRYLARYDVQKPFGPDNYYFSDTIQRRPSYLMPK